MRLLISAFAVWLSGCSFLFVHGPPPVAQRQPGFDCTESRFAPVVDTLLGALQVANLAVAASSTDQEWDDRFNGDPPVDRGAAVPLYVATSLLTVGSAVYGYMKTSGCRTAKAEMAERQQQQPRWSPTSAPPYAPAPYSPGSQPGQYPPPPPPTPYPPPPASTAPYPPPPASTAPYPPPPPAEAYPPPAPPSTASPPSS